ncbi:MAG TPA: hypothetical protein VF035_00555 [Longimicrobiales bacterium]
MELPTSPLNDPPRPDQHGGTPEWLLRVTIESVLIVISILLALAVDGMRDSRHNKNVARQSLEIFQKELCTNREHIEAELPFHIGLRDVVTEMAGDPERASEVRSLVEGLEPVLLLNTAWEAALATGALTHMAMTTVSGLSLTYSMQAHYMTSTAEGLPRLLLLPGTTPRERTLQAQQVQAYLTELVRSEQRLEAVYNEAIVSTESAKNEMTLRIGGSPRTALMASADGSAPPCERGAPPAATRPDTPSATAPAADSVRP